MSATTGTAPATTSTAPATTKSRTNDLIGALDGARGTPDYLEAIHALLNDPLALIEHNHFHRHTDRDTEDLLTLGQLVGLRRIGPVRVGVPVVGRVGAEYGISPTPPTQKEYDQLYAKWRPLGAAILAEFRMLRSINTENADPYTIVTAGGGAAMPFLPEGSQNAADDDFFVVGCDPSSSNHRQRLWSTVDCFIQAARRVIPRIHSRRDDACVHEVMTPGLLTISADGECKLQLILQEHPGCAIYGFDLPSCCVQYDGVTTLVTPFGAHAVLTRTNLVVPEYGSTSFEYRCLKKMHSHALALPHLCPKALGIKNFALSTFLFRDVRPVDTLRAEAQIDYTGKPVSDYEVDLEVEVDGCYGSWGFEHRVACLNAAAVSRGDSGRVVLFADSEEGFDPEDPEHVRPAYDRDGSFLAGRAPAWIDVTGWAQKGMPRIRDVVDRDQIRLVADRWVFEIPSINPVTKKMRRAQLKKISRDDGRRN